jgi:hypothetical protein
MPRRHYQRDLDERDAMTTDPDIGPLGARQSLTLSSVTGELTSLETREHLYRELQWHYSCHYFSETKGEEIVGHLIEKAPNQKAKSLLEAQLREELGHEVMYEKIIRRLGLNPSANRFGDAYVALIKAQRTFAEKVFTLQMLVEGVAFAYIEWRLSAIHDAALNSIDHLVYRQEKGHMNLAFPLFALCDKEELKVLTVERRREILRQMNQICSQALHHDLFSSVSAGKLGRQSPKSATRLDFNVARLLVKQAQDCGNYLDGYHAGHRL